MVCTGGGGGAEPCNGSASRGGRFFLCIINHSLTLGGMNSPPQKKEFKASGSGLRQEKLRWEKSPAFTQIQNHPKVTVRGECLPGQTEASRNPPQGKSRLYGQRQCTGPAGEGRRIERAGQPRRTGPGAREWRTGRVGRARRTAAGGRRGRGAPAGGRRRTAPGVRRAGPAGASPAGAAPPVGKRGMGAVECPLLDGGSFGHQATEGGNTAAENNPFPFRFLPRKFLLLTSCCCIISLSKALSNETVFEKNPPTRLRKRNEENGVYIHGALPSQPEKHDTKQCPQKSPKSKNA